MRTGTPKLVALAAAAGLAVTGIAACGGSSGGSPSDGSSGGGGSVTLNLVAYSTPQTAFEAIEKAFQNTPAGKDVKFSESYGASGDQSRAVAAGQPADIVNFSLEPDMKRLVDANIVAPTWDQNTHKGIVTDSVAAIIVRKGNPKGIHDWSDLVKPGLKVVNPNPFSSGGARWNIMAAYGAQLKEGKSPAEANAYLKSLYDNMAEQPESARVALQTFTSGEGDALLDYENDAIFAQQQHQPIDYVLPKDTILVENPVAVTSTTKHPEQAKAFLRFLYTPAAQKIFADNGFRPVVKGAVPANKFPTPSGLFTIAAVGGWDNVMTKFFDPASGVVAQIETSHGVPTTPSPTPTP
jgi:sulfate/thiosulfate-binding protein